ncbi:MAG: MarR family transcriptional regulator [Pseudomonadota bacterium]
MSTNSKGTDAVDVEIARLIDRLMRRIHATLNANAPVFDVHRIGPAGGILLLTLADIAPARLQDVVVQMARDKSQITRGIQALERKGLVERASSPEDGRVALLTLTAEGQTTVATLQRAVADALNDILAPLNGDQQRQLKTLLSLI